MLGPDQRSTLLELLEPPTGFALDAAVGLTYTPSLDALLTLPRLPSHWAGECPATSVTTVVSLRWRSSARCAPMRAR